MQRSDLTKFLAFIFLLTPVVAMSEEVVDRGIPPESSNNSALQPAEPIKEAVVVATATATFGPVHRSDTLWSIAKKLGGERGIPTHQMLAKLRAANQHAFIEGSVNALKLGAVLQIPGSHATLEPPKHKTERKTLLKHSVHHKWQMTAQTEPVNIPYVQSTGKTKDVDIMAPVNNAESAVPLQNSTAVVNKSSVDKVDTNMILDIQVRLEHLEQKIDIIQQQQQQLVPPNQSSEALKTAQLPAEQVATTSMDQGLILLKPYYPPFSGYIAGIFSVLGWQKWRKRKPEEGGLSTAAENTPSAKLGDHADILAPVVTTNWVTTEWMQEVGQRREQLPKVDQSVKAPSMAAGSGKEPLPIKEIESAQVLTKPAVEGAPHEFVTELNAFGAKQSPADMLAQVDLYVTHGHYEKAEKLLYQLIQQMPKRDEYKLKLLQIYCTHDNKPQFEAYVTELANAGRLNEHPFWGYVANMAQTMMPGSPLFAAQSKLSESQETQESNEKIVLEALSGELEFDFDFAESLPAPDNSKS